MGAPHMENPSVPDYLSPTNYLKVIKRHYFRHLRVNVGSNQVQEKWTDFVKPTKCAVSAIPSKQYSWKCFLGFVAWPGICYWGLIIRSWLFCSQLALSAPAGSGLQWLISRPYCINSITITSNPPSSFLLFIHAWAIGNVYFDWIKLDFFQLKINYSPCHSFLAFFALLPLYYLFKVCKTLHSIQT